VSFSWPKVTERNKSKQTKKQYVLMNVCLYLLSPDGSESVCVCVCVWVCVHVWLSIHVEQFTNIYQHCFLMRDKTNLFLTMEKNRKIMKRKCHLDVNILPVYDLCSRLTYCPLKDHPISRAPQRSLSAGEPSGKHKSFLLWTGSQWLNQFMTQSNLSVIVSIPDGTRDVFRIISMSIRNVSFK